MRGLFNCRFDVAGVAAAKTLIYITAPSSKALQIVGLEIENSSNETNEQCDVSIKKVSVLGTPTGSALTPQKTTDGDQASGMTGKYNITANEPTLTDEYARYGFGTLYGLQKDLSHRPIEVPPSGSVAVYLNNAPTAFDLRGNLWVKEVG